MLLDRVGKREIRQSPTPKQRKLAIQDRPTYAKVHAEQFVAIAMLSKMLFVGLESTMHNPYEPPQMNPHSVSKPEPSEAPLNQNSTSIELSQVLLDIRDTNRQLVEVQSQIAQTLCRMEERTATQMQMAMGRFRWMPFLIPLIILIPLLVQIWFGFMRPPIQFPRGISLPPSP